MFRNLTLSLLTVSALFINAGRVAAQCVDPIVNNPTITATGAIVSWDANANATSYEYTITTSPNPGAAGTITTNQSVMVQGLRSGTTYYLCLRRNCNSGGQSAWVCTAFSTPPTAVANATAGVASLNAYPNPVKDVVTVEFNGYPGDITISNIIGNVVYRGRSGADKMTINMQGFANGVYLLRYSSANGIQTTKIVKQ